MEKLLEKKNVIVEYNKDLNYLRINWVGFQQEEEVYKSGEEILRIFRGLNCSNVLNDNTKVQGPWNKAAEWTQTYWFPEMIKAGLKKFAWVFPDNIFAELSASEAMPDTGIVHKFNGVKSAEDWLQSTEVVL